MTKVIAVSDSHGLIRELEDIYFRYKDETNYFIHCGDVELDENHPVLKPYHCVNGNCDDYTFPNDYFFEVAGYKILVIHGHYQSVKYNLTNLYFYAYEKGANIVLFGHTHYPAIYHHENITFINPGSVLANRGIRGKSYVVLELGSKIDIKFCDVLTHRNYTIPK